MLVPRPSYPLFDHLTRLDLVVAAALRSRCTTARWSIDFASVERALTPRTRAVLVVSPNNPTGSFVSRTTSSTGSPRSARRATSRSSPTKCSPTTSSSPAQPAGAGRAAARRDVLSFALGGLSKSVGLPQVKLGWIAVGGPDALVAAALERLELVCDTYLSVSTPVQLAAAELLDRGAAVRAQIAARVATNYRELLAAVRRHAVLQRAAKRRRVVRRAAGAVARAGRGSRARAC